VTTSLDDTQTQATAEPAAPRARRPWGRLLLTLALLSGCQEGAKSNQSLRAPFNQRLGNNMISVPEREDIKNVVFSKSKSLFPFISGIVCKRGNRAALPKG
jgi:hypothetical protein